MSCAVVLLKSPPRDPTNDAYVQQLVSSGCTPYFIEVLESILSNERSLENIVFKGASACGFAGVVMTSSRAAEAWVQALRMVREPGYWSDTPFYVVGESTFRILKQIATSHPTKFSEALMLGAAQTGTSELLAQFVLADLQSRGAAHRTLLYLTGDKNRDTFHRIISESNVEVEDLKVYETMAAGDLGEKIALVAQDIEKAEVHSIWIIFFAPSSSDFALPHLRKYFRFSQVTASPEQGAKLRAKLGAIGPTTAQFLQSERSCHVDVVPAKPTAEQLVASICKADSPVEGRRFGASVTI